LNPIIAPINFPSKTWTLEKLEQYALSRADEISSFGRKTLEQTWLFGEVVSLIRDYLKEKGQWMDWVRTQPYSLSTATNAIKVFERVTFDELKKFDGMTASDMKVALDIIKMPPVSRKRQEEKSTPNAPEKAAKPDAEVKGVSTKKCDKQVAQQKSLKLFPCDNQEEEQPTTDHAPVEQPKESEEPETPATQPVSTEATIPSVMAMEYLHKINLKLEEIERGLVGVTPDDHLLSLINQAIATLQRLRGDVPADIDAA
jgi:hypothetical protein